MIKWIKSKFNNRKNKSKTLQVEEIHEELDSENINIKNNSNTHFIGMTKHQYKILLIKMEALHSSINDLNKRQSENDRRELHQTIEDYRRRDIEFTKKIDQYQMGLYYSITKNVIFELIKLRDFCIKKIKSFEPENKSSELNIYQQFLVRLNLSLERNNVYHYNNEGDDFNGECQTPIPVETNDKILHHKIKNRIRDGYLVKEDQGNHQFKKILEYELVEVYFYKKEERKEK